MFWNKNKKNGYTSANLSFFYIKVEFKRVYISRTCFLSMTQTVKYNVVYKDDYYEHIKFGMVMV